MSIRSIFILLLLSVTSFLYSGEAAADVTIDATLSPTTFPLDRMSRLTVTVNGASRNADLQLPEIDKISLHSRGQSSQISVINGSITSSLSHNYLVQASEPGDYTIPPINVKISGKVYTTEPIDFRVTTAGSNTRNDSNNELTLDEIAFLQIEKPGKHFPGEIVPITVKAYFNQKYRFDEIALPTLHGDGVVSPQIKGDPIRSQESINNHSYHVLIWNTSLSGVKVGEQPVKFSLDAALLVPQQRLNQSPFGDSFFNNFFGGYQRKPITLQSDETVFTVLPLPAEKKPANFTGAIGDFALEVSANPVKLSAGDPITLKIKITGNGNFDRVEAPLFPESDDWKTYTPVSDFTPTNSSANLGSKTFEQAIVAKNDGIGQIPPLSFSYFDPKEKAYITKTSKPIPITLEGNQADLDKIPAKVVPVVTQPETTEQSNDVFQTLAPIHLEPGNFQSAIQPLYKTTWYLLACAAAFFLIVISAVIKARRLNKQRHPEVALIRNKKQTLREDMQLLAQSAAASNSSQFMAQCRTTIQKQLGLKWNIQAAAISSTDLSKRLAPDSPLLEIFSRAEAAAYGAVSVSDEQMQAYITVISTELEKLL